MANQAAADSALVPARQLVEAALAYRRRGWMPIPVPFGSKNPNRRGWQTERPSEADIVRLWSPEPLNIGVLLGAPSGGLVDIDLDTAEATRIAPALLPHTEAIFGRTGKVQGHRLYRVNTDAEGLVKTQLWPEPPSAGGSGGAMLLEMRGDGAQTLFPPSRHPSGAASSWHSAGEPAKVAMDDLRAAAGQMAAATLLARHWPEPGSRHALCLSLASVLLKLGWHPDRICIFISAAATGAHDDEVKDRTQTVAATLSRLQSGGTVRGLPSLMALLGPAVGERFLSFLSARPSGARATPKSFGYFGGFGEGTAPQVWEPPLPFQNVERGQFPVDALAPWQSDYAAALATATQTPPDLPAMLLLSATAVAVAGRVELEVLPGWIEPLNIYTVTALPSGNRKSAVFAAVVAPIEAYEREQARAVSPLIEAAQTRYKIAEQRQHRAEAEAVRAAPTRREALTREAEELAHQLLAMQVPARPRLIADDATPERLTSLLVEQGGRMAVLSPEGDILDLMGGRYTGSLANFGVYLKAHAGDTLRIDRVGRSSEFVARPALTLGLSPQPSVIEGLARHPDFRGRGLLGRFWYSLPESLLGRRQVEAPPVPPAVQAEYERALTALIGRGYTSGSGENGGPPAPARIRLEPRAADRLRDFSAWLEPQLGEFGALGSLPDWGGKLAGAVARCAGLLHLADSAAPNGRPWSAPVRVETVERAVRVGEYLIGHARAAFALMGADLQIEDARFLLRWLSGWPEPVFSRRDAYHGTQARFRRVEALEPALDLLERHGYIRRLLSELPPATGRPPGARYAINPLWVSQNLQNIQK